MADIHPFNGIRYDSTRVCGNDVAAPPYDIISEQHKESLYEMSPYNIVRVDFGKELAGDNEKNNRYTRAANELQQWLSKGILIKDNEPSIYACRISYRIDGADKNLTGIFCLVKITELGSGVYPHEATHSKPKEDRLNLMRFCRGNISPVYSLYNSPGKITSEIVNNMDTEPVFSAKDHDDALHSLYKISDPAVISKIQAELSEKPLFIADGHHRYEVALEYKKEMDRKHGASSGSSESNPWDYVLMFLANMSDEGITVLPTHRLIKGLSDKQAVLETISEHFAYESIPSSTTGKEMTLLLKESGKNSFGLCLNSSNDLFILKYKGAELQDIHEALRNLDVVVLHEQLLKRDLDITEISYEMDPGKVIDMVKNSGFDAALILNPTDVSDVERIALSGLRMPPKSTYFYPKLMTGMVINKFDS
ncbi:MAG: DUF1015 domain-containing protein [Dissulfurispiraceae bacterium]|jgi:uncharacterized protein (DUF1015 family)|nr:DUF1015 domain-containing protein [Dissulfurispiraceae bacterium]